MQQEKLHQVYKTVCDVPDGNGFKIEYMPQLLLYSDIDDCKAHVHSFYEILWFQDGRGAHTVDFMEYEVQPGTIFFLSPGQIHHFDKTDGYKGVAIKMCTDMMKEMKLFLKYNSFHTHDSTPYFTIDGDTSKALTQILEVMERESHNHKEFGNREILNSLLCIFLAFTQRHGSRATGKDLDSLKPSHQLFIRFRELVEQEYTKLHTVQEYADRLHVAIRTLHKSVNECSNKSPLSFINGRIILEAKRLVRYSNLMIKEIASELGYEDPSYFVKFFKRQTGHLPSYFREMD